MWLKEEGVTEVISEAWDQTRDDSLEDKMKRCAGSLTSWWGNKIQRFGERIKQAKQRIDGLRHTNGLEAELTKAEDDLQRILE